MKFVRRLYPPVFILCCRRNDVSRLFFVVLNLYNTGSAPMVRPLEGLKVIELAGLAPAPYCGMILADFGAEVMVVDRLYTREPEIPNAMVKNPFDRGKRSIRLDLKTPGGVGIIKRMIRRSDVLLEPYRPGVMEKLGLGPDVVMAWNPRLIFARLTGWGQFGPYAGMAGHDIDYIAVSGALSLFRRKGRRPLPPCNILGDFAAGGLLCALGILLAVIERERSGEGQMVDAAMVDGAVNLSTQFHGLLANRLMSLDIGTHLLDGGAPFYQTYETADGKFVAVGALEKRFYNVLIEGLELDPALLPAQNDRTEWPGMKTLFVETFKQKTQDEWAAIFAGKDACVAPVLELDEVAEHPHNRARGLLKDLDGVLQPAPAPKLSRTPGRIERPGTPRGSETREVLEELNFDRHEIETLFEKHIVE